MPENDNLSYLSPRKFYHAFTLDSKCLELDQ